jgi:hypothetical protein
VAPGPFRAKNRSCQTISRRWRPGNCCFWAVLGLPARLPGSGAVRGPWALFRCTLGATSGPRRSLGDRRGEARWVTRQKKTERNKKFVGHRHFAAGLRLRRRPGRPAFCRRSKNAEGRVQTDVRPVVVRGTRPGPPCRAPARPGTSVGGGSPGPGRRRAAPRGRTVGTACVHARACRPYHRYAAAGRSARGRHPYPGSPWHDAIADLG